MKICNKNIETPIFLRSDSPFVLSVENSKEFYRYAVDFEKAFSGERGEFSFWEGDVNISPDKNGEIILSPFYFEATDKKIINLLYKKLQSNFNDGSFISEFNEVNARIDNFLFDLCGTVDFSLEHDFLSLESLLKACSVKPAKTYDSFLEKLICYINVFISLKSVSFFVLVGIKDVLTEEEILSLYKHCELNKVSLFLLERGRGEKTSANERKIIITEDLCEIVENISEMY